MAVLDLGGEFMAIDGMVVEKKALYIVEKLKDINPNIEVLALDPDRTEGLLDEPYQICERLPNGRVVKIFGVMELNDSVITRVQLADSRRYDIEAQITKANAKVREEQDKKFREELAAKKDLVTSIIKSTKSSYSYLNDSGDKVTIYEDQPSKVEKSE